jgi:hypothetical protein
MSLPKRYLPKRSPESEARFWTEYNRAQDEARRRRLWKRDHIAKLHAQNARAMARTPVRPNHRGHRFHISPSSPTSKFKGQAFVATRTTKDRVFFRTDAGEKSSALGSPHCLGLSSLALLSVCRLRNKCLFHSVPYPPVSLFRHTTACSYPPCASVPLLRRGAEGVGERSTTSTSR